MGLQRRLFIGGQQLVLFNPRIEDDLWVLPGHTKSKPRLARTDELEAYANAVGLDFDISFVSVEAKSDEGICT